MIKFLTKLGKELYTFREVGKTLFNLIKPVASKFQYENNIKLL